MKTNKKGKRILFIFAVMILICNLYIVNSLDASVKGSYEGQWYSKGFSDFYVWKTFVDTVINTVAKFIIVEKNNAFGLMLRDGNGNEVRTPYFGAYNTATGEMSGSIDFNLPNGEKKVFSGMVLVNGQSDLRKFGNVRDYINKTIMQLILDGIKNKWKVSFVGNKSKTTISPGVNASAQNPTVLINYEKYKVGDTSLVPKNYEAESVENVTMPSNYVIQNYTQVTVNQINITNVSNNYINQITINQINDSGGLEIINPNPISGEISILINITERFSVENSNYDSIKWYLDEKEIKKNSKFYDFKAVRKGNYSVKVEIKKILQTAEHLWGIEVREPVKVVEKSKSNAWIWILMGIILIIIVVIAIAYFLGKDSGEKEISEEESYN
ncbi:MAG: hypothetical protein AABX54_01045 [Nanoarchaeota archaeon]